MAAEGTRRSGDRPWDRVGIAAPLHRPGFRRLWSGLVISLAGDGIFLVAVAWQAYALADRASALAGVGLASALAQLVFLPLGGAVCDRLPRRRVLLLADAVRGAAVGSLALEAVVGHLVLWELWAAAAVLGAGTAFAAPAFDAIVPELVDESVLQQANGLDQVLRPGMVRLVGPALGGILVGLVGAPGAFAADAATFVVSACFVARLPACLPPAGGRAGRGLRALAGDLCEGLRYVRGEVWLWGTFLAATFTYLLFLGPTEVLVPYLVRNRLHAGAGVLGLVLALGGAGSVAAAGVVGQRRSVARPVTFMYAAWTGATLLVAGYGLARSDWQLAAVACAAGALEAAGTVVWATLKQRLVPRALLGRVSSIDWMVSTALMPISFALVPLVSGLLGAQATFIWAGVLGAVVTGGFLFLPGMRRPEAARGTTACGPREPIDHPELCRQG